MGNRSMGVATKILDVFLKNPNQPLTIFDLIRLTGLTKLQIQQSVVRLRERTDVEIDTLVLGQVYQYNTIKPSPKPEPEPVHETPVDDEDDWVEMRLLGRNKHDQMIVEDNDGKLYILEEL